MHSSFLISFLVAYMASGSALPLKELTARTTNDISALESTQKCYNTGEKWANDKGYALDKAAHFCEEFARGKYMAGADKAHCYNLSTNKKADFQVMRLKNKGEGYLGPNECWDKLKEEINCGQGGDRTYDSEGWRFV